MYSIHFKINTNVYIIIIVVKHDVVQQLKWGRGGGERGAPAAYVVDQALALFHSLVTSLSDDDNFEPYCIDG